MAAFHVTIDYSHFSVIRLSSPYRMAMKNLLPIAFALLALGCNNQADDPPIATNEVPPTASAEQASEQPAADRDETEGADDPATPEPVVEAEQSDEELIQGSWRMTYIESEGEEDAGGAGAKWVFKDAIINASGLEYEFSLDASSQPKQIDFRTKMRDLILDSGQKGIYRLEGDKLTICMMRGNIGERPDDFSTAEGNHRYLFKFERAKALEPTSDVELDPSLAKTIEYSLTLLKANRLDEFARFAIPPVQAALLSDQQWEQAVETLASRRDALITVYESLDKVEPTMSADGSEAVFDLSGFEIGDNVPVAHVSFTKVDGQWYLEDR